MKIEKLLLSMVLSVFSLGFVACNDDEELDDFYPIEFELTIVNADGENLLNPTVNSDVETYVSGITLDYSGQKYAVKDAREEVYRGDDFYGLKMSGQEEKTVLKIGRWNGNKNHNDVSFTINWNNGSKDVISFTNVISYNENDVAVVTRTYFLNGQMIESPKITFEK